MEIVNVGLQFIKYFLVQIIKSDKVFASIMGSFSDKFSFTCTKTFLEIFLFEMN